MLIYHCDNFKQLEAYNKLTSYNITFTLFTR